MSCGLPAIALRSLGPSSIVDDEKTGWLVPSDDAAAVAQALTEAVDDRGERCDEAKRPGGPCASASPGPPSSRGWLRPWPRRPPPRDRCS
jgi:glycosyltransferase involved in cell wall biosynthesis